MGTQTSGLKNLILAAALCAAPATAFAQAQGPYISGAGGFTMPRDSDSDLGSVDLDEDWAAVGALGYAFGYGLRGEVEFGYRQHDVGSVGGIPASGDVKAYSVMGNVLYDIPTGLPIQPYIGVGLGGAKVFTNDVAAGGVAVSGRDTRFAYQGIAGAAYNVTDQIALTADYRYFGVPDLDFTSGTGAGVDSEYATHMFMVGLRFTFGMPEQKAAPAPQPAAAPAPPPQPTPAPAPAAPRNYLVFFDWDSAELTPEAMDIVRNAAANAKEGGVSRIQAVGHADRSGATTYNLGLSKRRADAVKAALIQQGVSTGEIAVLAKGETDPLVPTPDGVREPQNRRVEIVLQ